MKDMGSPLSCTLDAAAPDYYNRITITFLSADGSKLADDDMEAGPLTPLFLCLHQPLELRIVEPLDPAQHNRFVAFAEVIRKILPRGGRIVLHSVIICVVIPNHERPEVTHDAETEP